MGERRKIPSQNKSVNLKSRNWQKCFIGTVPLNPGLELEWDSLTLARGTIYKYYFLTLIIVVCFKTELYTVDSVIEPSPTIPNIAQGGCVRYTDLTIILLITPVVLGGFEKLSYIEI